MGEVPPFNAPEYKGYLIVQEAMISLAEGNARHALSMLNSHAVDEGQIGSLKAEAYLALGLNDAAKKEAQSALLHNRAGNAHRVLAQLAKAEGNLALALTEIELQAAAHQESRDFEMAGGLLLEMGDPREARVAFAHALKRMLFVRPSALRQYAECERLLGRGNEARKWHELADSMEEPDSNSEDQ